MLLQRLGFDPCEIHYGWMLADGRMGVPVAVDGAATWLLLDTGGRYDVSIDLAYARKRGWPYERESDLWGRSPVADVFALGRPHARAEVHVRGRESDTTHYWMPGSFGVRYVNQGVLALDPVDVAVGWSAALDPAAARAPGTHRVALVPGTNHRVPVTLDLRDADAPDHDLRLVIDFSRDHSVLALRYVERAWTGSRRRRARRAQSGEEKVETHFHLPDGTCIRHPMLVVDEPGVRYDDSLGTRVDGYLGVDFLYRWLPVIDFPRATLWLAPLRP